jgi:hypothetical protein
MEPTPQFIASSLARTVEGPAEHSELERPAAARSLAAHNPEAAAAHSPEEPAAHIPEEPAVHSPEEHPGRTEAGLEGASWPFGQREDST